MCGIFALLNNRQTFLQEDIEKAFKKGEKRGPDMSSLSKAGHLLDIGFHRLSINGLDSKSNQPILIDNILLICNGEIYNFRELFAQLNIEPQTNSDCEIIIHLYKRYGIEYTLSLLDGVFGFVLYDRSVIEDVPYIHVARDPYGVRPVYELSSPEKDFKHNNNNNNNNDNDTDDIYKIYDNIIGFSSELKVLQDFLKKDKRTYYSSYRPNSLSPYVKEDMSRHYQSELKITQFKPGTYSTYKKDNKACSGWKCIKKNNNYHLNFISSHIYTTNITPQEEMVYKHSVWAMLEKAVYKRVVGTTDRPIACLLSGGLDSSLITSLVNKYYDKQVETYSIGMEGSEDLINAKKVAEHLNTKHTEIILTPDEFWDAIPEVIEAIESYDTTTVRASVGNYLIGKYIRKHSDAKVIFNGDGSDEVAGGYLYFLKAPDPYEFDKECRRLLTDIHTFDVLRSDKSISSHGLEPRTPFLDKSFVEMYLNIPLKLRCPRYDESSPKMEKYFLRDVVETFAPELLPKEILWRTKEAFSDGVSGNAGSWFEIIKQKVKDMDINKDILEPEINHPNTQEQEYYRSIFDKLYPKSAGIIPYFWMPKYVNATDASARTLDVYNEENNIEHESKLQHDLSLLD